MERSRSLFTPFQDKRRAFHSHKSFPHPALKFLRMEDNFIPLETQSQANIPVTPSESEGSKGKAKRHSEGLITAKKWTPIATQKSRKPLNYAAIQGKPTLTACKGKVTIINQVLTPKETLASKGTNQRTEEDYPEPEDLEDNSLDTVVDGKTMREIISTLPFTLQFNRNFKPEDWKDMDEVLQPHQLLKDLLQLSMDNKRLNLNSHWAELEASCQKICLKEIDFKDIMVITKGWNPTRQFRILEARATRIREIQATIQAIEEQLTHTGHTHILFRITRRRPNQLSSGLAPFRNQKISGQESPFFTIAGSFREKTRKHGQKKDLLQPEEGRVRPHDPEAVGIR
ncbi:hypothetical protein O181_007523 [Austropuccinia psidii MF-1]|uniref:Uncharacterized protein n=1 Tax=Austropuccinia psidii MF-1 TaxID=1389203 RepID=A0A9Q3BMC7_9BASI|nr:hypothetical protein [Austropuccinia psidii MF-1]